MGSENKGALVFKRSNEGATFTWQFNDAVTATVHNTGFGSSVAIDGRNLVIGEPLANVKISSPSLSSYWPDEVRDYQLDLGCGPQNYEWSGANEEPDCSEPSGSVGAAHLYKLDSVSHTATYDRLLTPYDDALQDQIAHHKDAVKASSYPYAKNIAMKVYSTSNFGAGWDLSQEGEIDLSDWINGDGIATEIVIGMMASTPFDSARVSKQS